MRKLLKSYIERALLNFFLAIIYGLALKPAVGFWLFIALMVELGEEKNFKGKI